MDTQANIKHALLYQLDLIKALAIDAEVNIDIAIALDLNPIFDSTLNGTDRLPNPSLRINTFDVEGVFGVNEWTTSLQLPPPLDDFKILVSEAKALVNISVEIPRENTPLIIGSKDDFLAFITPSSHSSNSISTKTRHTSQAKVEGAC